MKIIITPANVSTHPEGRQEIETSCAFIAVKLIDPETDKPRLTYGILLENASPAEKANLLVSVLHNISLELKEVLVDGDKNLYVSGIDRNELAANVDNILTMFNFHLGNAGISMAKH